MGYFSNWRQSRVKLTNTERQTLWKVLGSFGANQLGQSKQSYIQKGYEGNVDVYAVIKKLTDVTNSIPYVVEKKVGGVWELFEDSTLAPLMAKPNKGKGYTWDDIDEQMLIYLLANGNAYLVGETLGGMIAEVDVLPSQYVEVTTNKDFFLPNPTYKFELNQSKHHYDSDEIEHVRLFNPGYNTVAESFDGLSIIQVAAQVVQVGNDRWDANASILQNRGALGIITDKSDRPMTAGQADTAQEALDTRIAGTVNNGKTIVTNKDLGFIKLGMSATDLQLVESGIITLRAICNVFGMPTSLFGDNEARRNSNRKEDERSMYTNAIIPIADKLTAKHNSYVVANHYPNGDVRLRKDFSGVEALQEDQNKEAEKDKKVVEGIKIILEMPTVMEAKKLLIAETYDVSEDFVNALIDQTIPESNERIIPD